jgi:hypothetical protein
MGRGHASTRTQVKPKLTHTPPTPTLTFTFTFTQSLISHLPGSDGWGCHGRPGGGRRPTITWREHRDMVYGAAFSGADVNDKNNSAGAQQPDRAKLTGVVAGAPLAPEPIVVGQTVLVRCEDVRSGSMGPRVATVARVFTERGIKQSNDAERKRQKRLKVCVCCAVLCVCFVCVCFVLGVCALGFLCALCVL